MLDLFKSRGFWTAALAIVPSILVLIGVEDERTVAAVLTIVGALAGYFGVTISRSMQDTPKSHADVMAILERQRQTIEMLQKARRPGV